MKASSEKLIHSIIYKTHILGSEKKKIHHCILNTVIHINLLSLKKMYHTNLFCDIAMEKGFNV